MGNVSDHGDATARNTTGEGQVRSDRQAMQREVAALALERSRLLALTISAAIQNGYPINLYLFSGTDRELIAFAESENVRNELLLNIGHPLEHITNTKPDFDEPMVGWLQFILQTRANPLTLALFGMPSPFMSRAPELYWRKSVLQPLLDLFDDLVSKNPDNIYPEALLVRTSKQNDESDKKANKSSITEILNLAAQLSDEDHDLLTKALARQHALRGDPVAAEIEREVTASWANRKTDFPSASWIKNPSRFVAQVYAKWIATGQLGQWHLKHDPVLYSRYASHINEHPEDDLGLPKAQGRKAPGSHPR